MTGAGTEPEIECKILNQNWKQKLTLTNTGTGTPKNLDLNFLNEPSRNEKKNVETYFIYFLFKL
jgi:hypothetical protein